MSVELLKVKAEIKKKKPIFRRPEKHRKRSLPDNWRKPKGHHSKIRRKERPEVKMPLVGRRTPKKLRNFDSKGREIIMLYSVDDLKLLDNTKIGVVSSKLGLKKKAEIAKAAKGKGYNFMNFDPDKILAKVEEKLRIAKEKKEKQKKAEKEAVEEKIKEKPKKSAPSKPKKEVSKPRKESATPSKPKKEGSQKEEVDKQ